MESISGYSSPKIIHIKIRVGKGDRVSGSGSEKLFKDPIYISVTEDTPIGSYIHDIEPIIENNSEATSVFNFELFDQMPTSAFELARNPETSKNSIKLIRSLDYEQDQQYVMTVRITDAINRESKGGISFSTLLTVVVQVRDVNDITPVILSSDKLSLYSNVKLNVPVMKVIAADEDSGDNGRVSYYIIGGNADDTFQVSLIILGALFLRLCTLSGMQKKP